MNDESGSGTYYYQYVPSDIFKDKDFVIIENRRGSDGQSPSNEITIHIGVYKNR